MHDKFFVKYRQKILFLIFLLFLPYISCTKTKLEKKSVPIIKQNGETVYLLAEMAVTQAQRQYGFMNRKKIPEGTGMLFVFEQDQILSFWMKDTPVPLSIAFITSEGIIKDIFDMRPFSLASTNSTGYVRYALEVPQGWFERQKVKIGDRIEF